MFRPSQFVTLSLVVRSVSRQSAKSTSRSFFTYSSLNEKNPAVKYLYKLEQKAEQEGLSSVDELKQKYKGEIEHVTKEFAKVQESAGLSDAMEPSSTSGASDSSKSARKPYEELPDPTSTIKDLKWYIDEEKLKLHDAKEVELIWKARFADKDRTLSGSVNGETFANIYANARSNPTFVVPLPHEGAGAELHFVQWNFVAPYTIHCLITSLAEYKLHQEYARPHTTLAFHTNFLSDKSLVLMNGSVEQDSNVSLQQAQLLTLLTERFYASTPGTTKHALLRAFNTGSEQFSVDALLEESEKLE